MHHLIKLNVLNTKFYKYTSLNIFILLILEMEDDVVSLSSINTTRSALHRRAAVELGQLISHVGPPGNERPSIFQSTRPAPGPVIAAPIPVQAVSMSTPAVNNVVATSATPGAALGEKEKGIFEYICISYYNNNAF